jgi:DNA-binding NarL/FixJ family response regulator
VGQIRRTMGAREAARLRVRQGTRRTRRPRVLIAERQEAVRRGLRLALESDGFTASPECETAAAAFAAVRRSAPEICLVDPDLFGGPVAAAELASLAPTSLVVLLVEGTKRGDLLDALRAGAAGWLPKDIDRVRLPIALRGMLAGEPAVPRGDVHLLIDELKRHRRSEEALVAGGREISLTRREREVLEFLAQGRSTAEIAAALRISPATVRSQIWSMRRKLGVDSREAAIRLLNGEGVEEFNVSDAAGGPASRRRSTATGSAIRLRPAVSE